MIFLNWFNKMLNPILHMTETEDRVNVIKEDAGARADEISRTLGKYGRLRTKLIQRTTTYYIGRAAGIVK